MATCPNCGLRVGRLPPHLVVCGRVSPARFRETVAAIGMRGAARELGLTYGFVEGQVRRLGVALNAGRGGRCARCMIRLDCAPRGAGGLCGWCIAEI